MYFRTCDDIRKFKGVDRALAEWHMDIWQTIFVDKHGKPIKVEDVISYLCNHSIFDMLREVLMAIDAGYLNTDFNNRNMVEIFVRYDDEPEKDGWVLESIYSIALELYTDFESYVGFKESFCEVHGKPLEELAKTSLKDKSFS